MAYLDDFLLICMDYATSLQGQLTLIALLRMLGFSISWPKVVGPTHKKIFPGTEIDIIKMTIRLPNSKVVDLL